VRDEDGVVAEVVTVMVAPLSDGVRVSNDPPATLGGVDFTPVTQRFHDSSTRETG